MTAARRRRQVPHPISAPKGKAAPPILKPKLKEVKKPSETGQTKDEKEN